MNFACASLDARILLIDDIESFVDIAVRRMKAIGYSFVYGAKNLAEANEILKDKNIDVVISDWIIGEENGISFLLQLAKTYPKVRKVLLTGYGDNLDPAQRNALHQYNIELNSKKYIDTEYLGQIIEGTKSSRDSVMIIDQPIEHILGEQKLVAEQLIDVQRKMDRLCDWNRELVDNIMSELDHIGISKDREVIMGGGPRTINDIKLAIANGTEEGVTYVRLYHRVMKRILGSRGL